MFYYLFNFVTFRTRSPSLLSIYEIKPLYLINKFTYLISLNILHSSSDMYGRRFFEYFFTSSDIEKSIQIRHIL